MNAVTPAFPWASVSSANGWQNLNARRLFKEIVVRSHGDEPLASATQERGIVARDDLDIQVWNPESDTSNYKRIEPGQFVISLRSFQGGFEISRITGILSPAYTTLQPLRPELNEFYRWFFKSVPFISAVNSVASGIRQGKAIKFEDFASLSLPVPPSKDAGIIAAYLDRETGRIDALVERLERLIALLTEKRQAVISHAVFCDATTPMVKVGWLAELLPGYAFPSDGFVEEGVRLLRGVNVDVDSLRWTDTAFWSHDETTGLDRFWLEEGDIVLGMDRPWISRGLRVAAVEQADLPCLLLQRVARLRTRGEVLQRYLQLALRSREFFAHLEPDMTGVSVPHISPDQIKNFRIPLPSLVDQISIIERINDEERQFDIGISKAEAFVAQAKERRSALISAAVTGQIPIAEMTPDTQPEDAV